MQVISGGLSYDEGTFRLGGERPRGLPAGGAPRDGTRPSEAGTSHGTAVPPGDHGSPQASAPDGGSRPGHALDGGARPAHALDGGARPAHESASDGGAWPSRTSASDRETRPHNGPSPSSEGRSPADGSTFIGTLASATTSRPAPARFAACYASLAAAGATAIVSIHVSGKLSGTIESAQAAARDAPVPVEVIDSRSIAMGLGYPVLAAARAAARGASLEAVASAARSCISTTRTFFYVDTLEHLRRSGRIGTAASLFGSALMIKPLLHITDGEISLLEKVRTSSRAIARLEDLAVEAAGEGPVEVAVQHLRARERAEALAERLPKRIAGLVELRVVEMGAVIGVHVGPGMLGLTVASCDL
ncbi:DegV family protein [Nonomuraea rosea]|uniref:DegV family protein n=1 Tax=Nonomuraea rosea TaxID=638574 RepID=UPI0031ED4AD3